MRNFMKVLTVFICTIICFKALAQETVLGVETAAQKLRNENLKAETDLKALEQARVAATKKMEALSAKVDELKQKYYQETGIMGYLGMGDASASTRQLKLDLDTASKEFRDLDRQATNYEYKMAVINMQSKDVVEAIRKADEKATGVNKAVAEVLTAQGLTIKFSDLQKKIGNSERTLAFISSYYDQGTIGAYFKDKISRLLNSKLICDAQKSCSTGDSSKVENKKIEEVLFQGSTASTSRRDSYNRANKGSN